MIDYYAGVCWICSCGGARQVDHLDPVTENPGQGWRMDRVRPAHGAPGNPCPACSAQAGRRIFCNQLKGQGSVERARRIIAEMIAANGGKPAAPADRDRDRGQAGREW